MAIRQDTKAGNPMAKKSNNPGDSNNDATDDDASLFREMMGDVKPLPSDNRIPPSTKRPAPSDRSGHYSDDIGEPYSPQSPFTQSDYVDSVLPEENLFFARPGLQHKVSKRLRQGQIPIEADLDLHGFTIEEAAHALDEFIDMAQENDLRCVIVVHGKGHRSEENKPVLKSQINHWLRQHDGVMAFSSAMPKHGGVGAMYVILRRLDKR